MDARSRATPTAPAPVPGTITVLIGFAEALAAPETAWSLRDGGAHVVAFTRRGSRPALRHARGVTLIEITPPEIDAEAAIADVAAILAGGRAGAVMPLDDAAVWLCDAVARRASQVVVAGPTGVSAALALDKRRQLSAARAAGFAVPPTTIVQTYADLRTLATLPVAVKPALAARQDAGRLRRGSGWMCGNGSELEAAGREWGESEPLLAQPLITGTGEGLFGLAGPEGIYALSAHRRVRMMNPQGSGSSACRSIEIDPELAAGAQRMLHGAGWRGLFMLEFLRDADGVAWFMELNGRTWGSMALARRQGLEYPAWALSEAVDPAPDRAHATARSARAAGGDEVVCRHLGRELVHLLMVLRGPGSVALTEWPSRRRALSEVLGVRRGERWYNWRAGESRVLVADTAQTLLAPLRGRR